jgi:hypothetical protein
VVANALNVEAVIQATDESAKCEVAKHQYFQTAMWRGLFTALLFFFSVVLIIFASWLIYTIAVWLSEGAPGPRAFDKGLQAALSAAGSVASGVVVKFVNDRRKDMVDENNAAKAGVDTSCDETDRSEAEQKAASLSPF